MTMEYDAAKLDEVVLALLHLNAHTDHGVTRASFNCVLQNRRTKASNRDVFDGAVRRLG